MQCKWLGERVAKPNLRTVVRNVVTQTEAAGWGPNAKFAFPARGGTGGIWKAVAAQLDSETFRYGRSGYVKSVKTQKKVVKLADGRRVRYKHLISTAPVDKLLEMIEDERSEELLNMRSLAREKLVYSATIVIGIGFRGSLPERLISQCCEFFFSFPPSAKRNCERTLLTIISPRRTFSACTTTFVISGLYFPESDCPFYRATIFSNYSPHNVPSSDTPLRTLRAVDPTISVDQNTEKGGPYWSLMFEVCQSAAKPVNLETILEDTIQGALNTELASGTDEIVSLYMQRFERG